MTSTYTEEEIRQMNKLRSELSDCLTPDVNTDFNIHRWIHGWRGNVDEASRRFRTYIENRKVAGLDDPNYLENVYTFPIVTKLAPYFSFTLSPNIINPTDNTVLTIQRFQNVDYHASAKMITCNDFLLLYFAICEWDLRQVLKCERESGRESGLTLIFDLENFPLLQYANPNSAIVRIFIRCLCLLQDYFCDMLHRLLIINPPSVLNVVLAVVKRFLHPITQQKFVVISNKDDLLKYVDSSVLPVRYGGNRRLTVADTRLGGLNWNMDFETCTLIPRPITNEQFFQPRKFMHKSSTQSIEPKGKFEIRRRVGRVGAKLIWQFTVSSEVQFTVVRFAPDGKKIRLIPCWVVITPKLPEEGSLTCVEAGDYALEFSSVKKEGWFSLKLEYYFEIEEHGR